MAVAVRSLDAAATASDPARMAAVVSRNIAWSYASWAVSLAGPLITIPFYVRFLGHQMYGQWLVILSLTSYLGLANLGMGQTVSNRIAEALAGGRRNRVGALVSTAFYTYAAIGAGLIGAAAVLTPWVCRRYLSASTAVEQAFLVYVVLIALGFPLKVQQMALRAFQRVDCDAGIEAAAGAGRILLVVIALAGGLKLLAVALLNGGTTLAGGLVAYLQALRLEPHSRPRLGHFSRRLLATMVKPSAAFFALQIGFTLVLGIDNLVIGCVLGGAAVTRYAVPFRLMWIAAGLFSVAIGALTPTVTANYACERNELLQRGWVLSMRLGLLYAAAGAMLLWLAGPGFIRLWAGPGVMPSAATYAMQVLFFALLVCAAPSSTVLWATSRHYGWAALTLVEGTINLLLSIWGVRRWGLSGVIGATILASLLTNAWFIPYAAITTLEIPLRMAVRALAPGAGLGLLAVALTLRMSDSARALADASSAVAWLSAIALFVGIYFRVVFSHAERLTLWGWVGRCGNAIRGAA